MPKTKTVKKEVESIIEEVATEQPDGAGIRKEVLERMEAQGLKEKFVPTAVRMAIDQMRYQIQSRMRQVARDRSRDTAANIRANSIRKQKEYWESYTVLGTSLKECTEDILESSINHKEAQAQGKLQRAKFEERIAERLDEGDRVEDKWTLEEIEALAEELL